MTEGGATDARGVVEAIYRSESRRVLATLIRLLGGDFDRAEEAMHDAFSAAAIQWPRDGVPANPRAWLVSAGRFKAIDRIRKQTRFDAASAELAERMEAEAADAASRGEDDPGMEDDRLRLIFTCCHPALAPDAQVALTLREVCGLTTEEIARAFLTNPPTVAQRIVRAKAKIRDARIPYEVPDPGDLPLRLEPVLRVIYLVFNEGYAASAGDTVTRADLSAEAIRVGRLLAALLPDPETIGLLALMLLQESRRSARATAAGDIVLFADQDRALWDAALMEEGRTLAIRAMTGPEVGPYAIQSAIAAVHSEAGTSDATNWRRIVALYDLLLRADPSPVVRLNRAVAVAMRDGPGAGLSLIDALIAEGDLATYRFAHSARADLLRRLGRTSEARAAYETALSLTEQEPERRFIEGRLRELVER